MLAGMDSGYCMRSACPLGRCSLALIVVVLGLELFLSNNAERPPLSNMTGNMSYDEGEKDGVCLSMRRV